MRRALLAAAAAFALCALAAVAAPAPPVRATAEIAGGANVDLLAPVTVRITLHNALKKPQTLAFATGDNVQVQVRDGATLYWDSLAGHAPIAVQRTLNVPPGTFPLVSQLWDGTTSDHRAVPPGSYQIRVAILNLGSAPPEAYTRLTIATPRPIAAALAQPTGAPQTIAGVPHLEHARAVLTDESGSVLLSRPLGRDAAGPYVVRGYLTRENETTVFVIDRFAPSYENTKER